MRPVKTGYYDLKRYEVLDGVKPGDLVVTEDQGILQDGAKARIARKVEAPKAARQ